jgi:HEPN domain-containing protein
MSVEGQSFYPGETASPQQIVELANEYRRAAEALLHTGRRKTPLSWAPFRLVAIHAIELYLNALLLAAGHPSAKLRGLQHDLASRTKFALSAKLTLRKRTLSHLESLSKTREYLTTRYDPAASASSQLNRLEATLSEVAEKVTALVDQPAGRTTSGA